MKRFLPVLFLLSSGAFAQAPSLNIYLSRAPLVQGEPYAIFVSDPNVAGHPALTLTATLDGSPVTLTHPESDIWAYMATPGGLMQTHDFQISLSENNAVVGTQDFSYSVAHAGTDPNFPNFTSVTPPIISTGGGTTILVSGSNFTNSATLKIAGISVSTTFIDSQTLLAMTPDLSGVTGPVALEVYLPPASGSGENRNVVAGNVLFSSNTSNAYSEPVAVISQPNRNVTLGSIVSLDGSASYDPFGLKFSYEWVFLSVPVNSTVPAGSSLPDTARPSFLPDVAGLYVVRLVVRETQGTQGTQGTAPLASSPELAVIQAGAGIPGKPESTGRILGRLK